MAKIKLKSVRLSFPELFEPTQFEGKGPYSYKAAFLIEPGSDNHKLILATMKEVATEAWKAKAGAVLENADDDSKLRFLQKGDKKEYDGYAGMLVISAKRDKSKGRPLLLHKNPKKKDPDTGEMVNNEVGQDEGTIYGGCYVNVTIEMWAQDNNYGKTIRAQLLAVQFVKDGDAFGGGNTKGSAEDFEDLSDSGDDDSLIEE